MFSPLIRISVAVPPGLYALRLADKARVAHAKSPNTAHSCQPFLMHEKAAILTARQGTILRTAGIFLRRSGFGPGEKTGCERYQRAHESSFLHRELRILPPGNLIYGASLSS